MLIDKQTETVRAAVDTDPGHRAVIPPLHLSSNFAFDRPGHKGEYDYTRSGNPTRDHLGRALADLEGGTRATVTATGMAAVVLATRLLKHGDLLIAPHDCYGGCQRAFRALADAGAFELLFLDLTQPEAIPIIESRRPRMVWVETPSNPLLRITDIRAISEVCRRTDAWLAVDNTFLSPALQRPLELGADVVIHSTTKYLNGHSDVVGGAVVAADPALGEELAWWANCVGTTGSPFDSYLTLRGLRTLHARWSVHLDNAAQVVGTLLAHQAVSQVYYPGLPDHPGHAIAAAQHAGHGAIVSFELQPEVSMDRLVENLRWFTLAESLGGVESLIAHPATMTHASMTEEAQRGAGIGPQLLRLSVGIERGDDLAADLAQALDAAAWAGAGTGARARFA